MVDADDLLEETLSLLQVGDGCSCLNDFSRLEVEDAVSFLVQTVGQVILESYVVRVLRKLVDRDSLARCKVQLPEVGLAQVHMNLKVVGRLGKSRRVQVDRVVEVVLRHPEVSLVDECIETDRLVGFAVREQLVDFLRLVDLPVLA